MVIQVAEAIKLAEQDGLQSFSQGVAAKLINSYLKDRFLCGGDQEHPRIRNLHPPIDTLLLDALAQANFGEQTKEWRRLGNKG